MKYLDYSEKKKHGKPDFPIQYYYVDKNHEQYVMPLHWHRELELIRVKKGTLEIYLNNVPYFINAHEHIVIQGGMLHRGVPHDCVYECVVLDLFMLCRHKNDIADSYIMPVINRKSVINPTVGKNYDISDRNQHKKVQLPFLPEYLQGTFSLRPHSPRNAHEAYPPSM